MNRVCTILGIEKPIIQGPMAWTSTAPLVAAVSNAGGPGVLGVGFAPIGFVLEQVKATRALTQKPFAINVIMDPASGILDKIVTVVKEEKVPVVYADTLIGLDYALSKKYFDIWHELGARVIVKASDIRDAVTAEKAGADIVIVKGWEGGGHVTVESTMVLVPQAADVLEKTPLVAAGGIADGRGMAAVMAMGAEGIEMGTVFLAAAETPVHPNVKTAVLACGDMQTVITGTATGEPCRQIANALSEEILRIEAEYVRKEAAERLRPVAESSLKKAMAEGDTEHGAVMAGQIAPLVNSIRPVADIMNTVIAECRAVMAGMSRLQLD